MGKFSVKMRSTLSTNYVIPAVLLNPILFLHSLNALLSRILPPITIDAAIQPAPYYPLGPSSEHPHIDLHKNDNLCWSYTIVIVFAQMVAIGRINRKRQEMRERDSQRQEHLNSIRQQEPAESINLDTERMNQTNGHPKERKMSKHPPNLSCDIDQFDRETNGHVIEPKSSEEWSMVR